MSRIFKLVCLWIIGLFAISFIGAFALPRKSNWGLGAQSETNTFNYYLSLAQWDGGNYIEIAKNGYKNEKNYAFSPLYPQLISLLAKVTNIDLVLSALMISISAFLVFIIIFHKYTKAILGKNEANCATLTFIFFPTSFFCLLVYSESIFLLLMIISFYALLKKRYITSVIATSIAPLDRFIGIFLILANTLKTAKQSKNPLATIAFLLSAIPFVMYVTLLNYIFQNPLIFANVQRSWGRFALDPITTIFSYFVSTITFQNFSLNSFFDLTVTTIFLAVLVLNPRKLPLNVWAFSILAILIPASTGTLVGIPRYALASLGTFILFGKFLQDKPKLKIFAWSLSLALQCILIALFITGHWIA